MNTNSAVLTEGTPKQLPERQPVAEYRGETYYGVPPVKHSTYKWIIGTSYFAIGLAGAAQVLSTLLDLADRDGNKNAVRVGRYLALAGALITPGLYIKDLGTPRKWYNMLRIFRPSSLMSTGGVWALADFGVSCGFSAVGQLAEDTGFPKTGRLVTTVSGVSGLPLGAFMSVYMGTELEETSTPLWAEASPLLAPLFAFNNASNALAAFEIAGAGGRMPKGALRAIRLLAIGSEAAEIALLRLIENKWTRPARQSAGFKHRYQLLLRTGMVTMGKLVGIVTRGLQLRDDKRWAGAARFAPLSTLAAGFLLPNFVLFAGNRSADRPQDYFEFTKPSDSLEVPSAIQTENPAAADRPQKKEVKTAFKWLAAGLALGGAAIVYSKSKAGRATPKSRLRKYSFDM